MDEEPSYEEFEKALDLIAEGKASEMDQVPGEVLKHRGGEVKSGKLWLATGRTVNSARMERFKSCYRIQEEDRTGCENYRGIALLSVVGKLLARILLNTSLTRLSLKLRQ